MLVVLRVGNVLPDVVQDGGGLQQEFLVRPQAVQRLRGVEELRGQAHHLVGQAVRLAEALGLTLSTLPQLVGATHCMLDTMRCTPLKVALSDSNRFDWALASEAIWFRDRDAAGQPRLVKHDLRTGQVASFDFAPSGAGSSIAISPDGKRLIVMREAPPAIDLMLARRAAD